MTLKLLYSLLTAYLPFTGETSTLPMVLAFLGIALVLLIIMLILKRRNR